MSNNRLLPLILTCLYISSVYTIHDQRNRWVWVYHKKIASSLQKKHHTDQCMFKKERVPHFSQLIFSWNAKRPEVGNFSFSVQIHDAHSKKWGKWHRMMDWGATKQCSYASPSDGFSHYVYVRLEMEPQKIADGFAVKIESHQGALLSNIQNCTVSLANFYQFQSETLDKHLSTLPSIHIENVPQLSQFAYDHPDNHRICSPTSCSMVMRFFTGNNINPLSFAQKAFDHGLQTYGSWPFNIAHAFELSNDLYWGCVTRLNSFLDLHKRLMRGLPTIVSVRGTLSGAPKPYANGHLLVVVGWDLRTRQVICHDPAFMEHNNTMMHYSLADFLRAWELSHRLAYRIDPY